MLSALATYWTLMEILGQDSGYKILVFTRQAAKPPGSPKIVLDHVRVYLCALGFLTVGCI